jgi:threonine dehydrogenase-like Zn-dependent dehydrogenase
VITRHSKQKDLLVEDEVEVIDETHVTEGEWDVVIEATGSPQGFAIARRAVRPRGVMVLKSTYKGELSLNMSSIVVDEITLVGSRCGPFEPALRYLAGGCADPRSLIDSIYGIEEGLTAFKQAAKPGIFKVLLTP